MKSNKLFTVGYLGDITALIIGALLTLAFAPYDIFPIGILSPALLLALWLHVSPKRAFFRGWLYGLGLFGTGVHWVFISIHTYGHASLFLSSFITSGFIIILALFPAMTGYLLNRYFPTNNNTKILCAFPAIWVLLEWSRSWLFTGFPWLSLGDSQLNSPLKGYAPILSMYSVSLVALISSALLINGLLKLQHKQRKIAYYQFFTLALLWFIGGTLSVISWTKPLGAPIQVSLVQGNIPQELKWSPDNIQPTLDHYESLSKPLWKNSKIIIWPEGAIPITLQDATEFVDKLDDLGKLNHSTLITGIPVKVPETSGYYNAVIAVGEGTGIYLKRRLVPFGEYMPLGLLHKLFTSLDIPMSDFVPSTIPPKALDINGTKISVFICYEITYVEQVLRSTSPDTGIILTVSNDAWFGHSVAQAQHLQAAAMRALEMGRPVLFVSNDGITAIIGPDGKIQASAPPYQTTVLTDKVQPMTGQTPWQKMRLDPLLVILIGMLFTAIKSRKN